MKTHLFNKNIKKFKSNIHILAEKTWYEKTLLSYILWPFSLLYKYLVKVRRFYLQRYFQQDLPVPIIVVGNITVGGVGKTPLVIALAEKFTSLGLDVGIVSRGFGAQQQSFPCEVKITDSPSLVGDEPLLLANRTQCKVVIDPDRSRAVSYLIKNYNPDIIISDDGLQHYKMNRTIEIAVLDGSRNLGNGFCLPAGPLREESARLNVVDFIVINSSSKADAISFKDAYSMHLQALNPRSCFDEQEISIQELKAPIRAIAAIGNPARFFVTIKSLGIVANTYKYPDHYLFSKEDFNEISEHVIMTEKDYVKCKSFSKKNMYYVPVNAELEVRFWQNLLKHPKLALLNFDNKS